MRTTTSLMVAKALAAIALTASTAGGVALATQSSPAAPEEHLSGATVATADSDAAVTDLGTTTTPPATTPAESAGPPDTPPGLAEAGPAGRGSDADDTRSGAGAHPTGLCRASSNITDAEQSGKAADSPAFADLDCSDNGTDSARPTGRPSAPPGNPEQRTGAGDTERPDNPADDGRDNPGSDKQQGRSARAGERTGEGSGRADGSNGKDADREQAGGHQRGK